MGLLDGLLNDPNQMAQLQLGAGLLGGGSFGQALNRGLLGYQNTLDSASDRALKKTLTQAQLDNYRSEIAQRDVATQKAKLLQDFIGGLGSSQQSSPQVAQMPGGAVSGTGGTAGMPGQGMASDGGTAPMPTQSAAPSVGGNSLLGLDIAKIAKLKAMGGPDLLDAFKYANDPLKMEAGSTYRDRVTGAERTLPLLDKGQAFSGGRISNIPGAVDAAAELTGANASATEAAKARNDLTQVYDPSVGGMVFKSRAQVLGNTPQQQSMGGIQNRGQGALSPDLQALIMRDAQANGIQNPTANFTGAGARGRYELASPPVQSAAPTSPATSGSFAAGPTAADVARNEGDKTYSTSVAKDQVEQRKSIASAGFNAPGRISKYQQIDKLLGDFEGGALSASGLQFASAMNSLGIKADKNLPNKEAAQALTREIALGLRNPSGGAGMPGAMSDADREFLASMTPNLSQSAQGRKQIIQTQIAIESRNQQVADFARKYEAKHGKLDDGFYSQLANWSSANPLFGK